MAKYFDDVSGGPAILFSHGTLMDRTMFDPQVDDLARDYRCVAFDSRARTDRRKGPYSLDDMADDCIALMDQLSIRKCVLVGMSLGGFMAFRLALRYPDRLDGLVLVSTQAKADPDEFERFGGWFEKLRREPTVTREFADWCAKVCFGPTTWKKNRALALHWRDRWMTLPGEAVYWESQSWLRREDLSQKIAAIKVPVLIVHGDEDRPIPLDRVRPMLDVLPDARLAVLPGVGHTANSEAPAETNREVRAFMRRIHGR
jgi:pimeloyl-ACP methyl ester carboxylesterase